MPIFVRELCSSSLTSLSGLVSSQTYSILEAVEYKGKRFLKIRSPWGHSKWTGRWSDGSKEWTKEWREALESLHHDFGDDGVFIMEYEDFLETWSSVECTQLFDSSWIQSSHWLNVTSRTFPCAWQFGDVSCTHQAIFVVVSRTYVRWRSHVYHADKISDDHRPLPSRHQFLGGPFGSLHLVL